MELQCKDKIPIIHDDDVHVHVYILCLTVHKSTANEIYDGIEFSV